MLKGCKILSNYSFVQQKLTQKPLIKLVWQASSMNVLHCVPKKNIPDIFNCNLETNYRILTIFRRNILDTTCHQTTI